MRARIIDIGMIALMLLLGTTLSACGRGNSSGDTVPVPLDTVLANPQQYAGQYVCTEGMHVDGFEASGLAASTYEEEGNRYLTDPVIWLEGADIQSREDCTQTDTDPALEFCLVTVCGVFETEGDYGHGGAYAYQIRGADVSALPSPAFTSPPLPTVSRDDKTPIAPGPDGEALPVEPPPAILEIGGQEQISGIGTYCWTQPQKEGNSVAVCADMVGISTAEEPLVAGSPFTATFRLIPEEMPDELLLEVIPVTDKDEFEEWPAGSRGWPFQEGERHSLNLEREPSIELSLEPGLYVLNLFGRWQVWGDASYGFLVEVQSPSSSLVVDETPIVDAEVDGPGHVEYSDRLGEEILARMRGLWARAAELRLERNNAALAPFDYRLEARFDAERNQDLYDLFHEGDPEPVALGLSYLWPVSVNASGTNFSLVVEKAPDASLYHVQTDGIQPWDDADLSNWLPPGYVGDALAQLTFTGFPTITYQVELDSRPVYSGTAMAMGAYMPLRFFTTWDGHWVVGVDDHLIVDGQDLGETLGYDAAFDFRLIRGEPFYFFEQGGQVRLSYGGRTLPNAYDQVFHNQCCEAAIHNPLNLGDTMLFHALWNGTWYFVEAGVYDGEMSGTYRYSAPEGWSFRYPMHWDRLDEELGLVQDTATGKTVTFASLPTTQAELEHWLESEIARKLAATEAENTLAEPLTTGQEGALTVYRYAILLRNGASETLLRTTVLFDGQRRYEFYAAIPPVAEEEYASIVASLQPASK
jgi:hypothetical protein